MSIIDKVKAQVLPEKEYIKHFRKKYIPKKYNQIKLVDYLEDENIDHYISISNRADGKSFNYLHYFLDLAIRKDIGFTLIARHYTVRFSYQKLLQEIIDDLQTNYNKEKFFFIRNDFYILVGYEDKELGIITDLNQAQDLKYLSNYIKHFPIIIYDEFLALEGEYLIDEWERLKTIYSSINRNEDIPYIKIPKLFYLGNAVNFSSPVLSNLNLFNHLATHEINTVQVYDNIAMEVLKNNNANDRRNLRAFDEENDTMTHGQFKINEHNLITDEQQRNINKNKERIIVKAERYYLVIEYNKDTFDTVLEITHHEDDYNYNIELVDNKSTSIYLDVNYYDEEHYKKYNKDFYLFKNQYTKDIILSGYSGLSGIKINRLIGEHHSKLKNDFKEKEKQIKENYIEETKKSLFSKFYNI